MHCYIRTKAEAPVFEVWSNGVYGELIGKGNGLNRAQLEPDHHNKDSGDCRK